MVSSVDGFIARKDGSVDWMESKDTYEKGIALTEEYVTEFVKSIDCYVMGSKTYEHALKLGWPYGDVPVIVITKRNLSSDRKSVEFYKGDLTDLVNNKLRTSYKNIWMVGGAETTKNFIQLQLADEIVVTIIPIILGDGMLYFDYVGREQLLHLKDVTAFNDGMVEMCYELKKK